MQLYLKRKKVLMLETARVCFGQYFLCYSDTDSNIVTTAVYYVISIFFINIRNNIKVEEKQDVFFIKQNNDYIYTSNFPII